MSKNYWKQPITTESLEWPTMDRVVFCEIMLRARNEPEDVKPFWHGNKHYTEEHLERGQCIFVTARFANELNVQVNNVRKALNRLIKKEVIMELNRKPYGFIVTVKDYDEQIKMKLKEQVNQQVNRNSKDNSMYDANHKSVYKSGTQDRTHKSVTQVKTEEEILAEKGGVIY